MVAAVAVLEPDRLTVPEGDDVRRERLVLLVDEDWFRRLRFTLLWKRRELADEVDDGVLQAAGLAVDGEQGVLTAGVVRDQ
jgi:hypothetical protein